MAEKFEIWKNSITEVIQKEKEAEQAKVQNEENFQRKVESAQKFRLRKQLILKHMVLKRMRRVIKAEKKWLETVKIELTIYEKKRFFKYWKISNGLDKLEKARKQRIYKYVIRNFKDNVQRHILNEQIAIMFRKKVETKALITFWHSETTKSLKIKADEAKSKKQYEDHLKRDAFKMFASYYEIMKAINSDEFLKLAEKQDYFEIGITKF